ncbi:MAG: hypothetical protein NZO58_14380, partial [Gemmataceae bacterium]|nr:hypothetical protein [Gemmataceae bacterium]
MRTASFVWVAAAVLVAAPAGRAGVYNTCEPFEDRLDPKYDESYHRHLLILRSIGMDQVQFDNPQRRRYMLLEALAAKADVSRFTV